MILSLAHALAKIGLEVLPSPFFVALVDRFGQIVEKQSFSAQIAFPKNAGPSSRTLEENIVLSIPVRSLEEADSYETIVSFQLTKEQLEQTYHK